MKLAVLLLAVFSAFAADKTTVTYEAQTEQDRISLVFRPAQFAFMRTKLEREITKIPGIGQALISSDAEETVILVGARDSKSLHDNWEPEAVSKKVVVLLKKHLKNTEFINRAETADVGVCPPDEQPKKVGIMSIDNDSHSQQGFGRDEFAVRIHPNVLRSMDNEILTGFDEELKNTFKATNYLGGNYSTQDATLQFSFDVTDKDYRGEKAARDIALSVLQAIATRRFPGIDLSWLEP